MESLINIQKRLLPDLLIVMRKRYHILQYLSLMEPVGRRSLAASLGLTERILRSEVEFLKEQNLLSVSPVGMSLTNEGKEILQKLASIMREVTGIDVMEAKLKKQLNVKEVIVVSGNSDESPWVKSELGRTCANIIRERLCHNDIIAVTGGSTMAAVAEKLTRDFYEKNVLFVPARGGIGEDVKNQANTICAKMAEVTGARHRVLYVPDQVSKEMYQSIMKEPQIHDVLTLIKSAGMVLHGIGDAMVMAKRRNTVEEDMKTIIAGKAAGEAFGYYFDKDGKIVHKVQTIGLQLDDLKNVRNVIAVAGGATKGNAIRAYMNQAPPSTILITDEGAANALIEGESP